MSPDIDDNRYAAVTAAATAQLAAYDAAAARLARQPVEARSKDGRLRVRAAAGAVIWVSMSEDILARYPVGALGDMVTRTVREAQRRAAEAYERGLAEVDLSAVAEVDRIMATMFEEIERQQ